MEPRNGYREVSIPSPWEQFCREEAKDAASRFVERIRSYKVNDPAVRGIHESFFASEFSASFMEEVLALSREEAIATKRGTGRFSRSRKTSATHSGGHKEKGGGGKSWWNIFRWGKSSSRSKESEEKAMGAAVPVMEGVVNLLNMNDPSQSINWQQCRLVLGPERGNYQLAIFCPPKNTVPKMSLFCFLIEDVRSTTSLELPDFTSTFVVKSQNHGEYVFDVGTEELKKQWIKEILQFSAKAPSRVTNGHIPRSSPAPLTNGHSHSNQSTSIDRSHTFSNTRSLPSSSLAVSPPPLPPSSRGHAPPSQSISPEVVIESLNSSPVVFTRNRTTQPANGNENVLSVTASARSSAVSEESVLCDISSFMKLPPPRLQNKHARRSQSMFVEPSALLVNPPTSSSSPPPPPTFTSSSPPLPHMASSSSTSSPPPLPKRSSPRVHQRSSSCSNRHSPPSTTGSNSELRPPDQDATPHSPDAISCSSFSSALHPVSLAAVNQRTRGGSPAHRTSATSLNHPIGSFSSEMPLVSSSIQRNRKVSAPVVSISQEQGLPLLPSREGLRRGTGAGGNPISEEQRSISSEGLAPNPQRPQLDIYSSGFVNEMLSSATTQEQEEEEESGSQNCPCNNRDPSSSEGALRPYTQLVVSDQDPHPVGAAAASGSHAGSSYSSPVDMSQGATPPSTRSSSQSDSETIDNTLTNPIYIETTEDENHAPQVPTHTHHPYESWATSQQDVHNLRSLAMFPWFHGMISRANASQLVLVDGESGTGQFLVRQSESREGDFVLTFNYHNRPKHLRMTVDESGCNIQHLWFDSVPSMLEYFKTNSIPLETFWLNDDVKLTTYINRTASDAFRTTTVVNMERLSRTPPRRSRSLHLGMSQSVNGSSNPSIPSPTESNLSRGPHSNSFPHTIRSSTGWRQLFRTQRASSAQNVGRIQRRHSANAGSILDTRQPQATASSREENNYVYRC